SSTPKKRARLWRSSGLPAASSVATVATRISCQSPSRCTVVPSAKTQAFSGCLSFCGKGSQPLPDALALAIFLLQDHGSRRLGDTTDGFLGQMDLSEAVAGIVKGRDLGCQAPTNLCQRPTDSVRQKPQHAIVGIALLLARITTPTRTPIAH